MEYAKKAKLLSPDQYGSFVQEIESIYKKWNGSQQTVLGKCGRAN
jgi:hypothetical protein